MKKQLLFALMAFAALSFSVGFISAQAANAATTSVYRLYNHNTGEHFYTTSVAEKNADIKAGWTDEGNGWTAPSVSSKPVYRVYNPNAKGGDHYYTQSKYEASTLVSKGWHWDNNGKPVFYSGGGVPVYVAYNPNAQSGAHNYTTNKSEQNNLLSVGWKYSSVAWYAVTAGTGMNLDPNHLPQAFIDRLNDMYWGPWPPSKNLTTSMTPFQIEYKLAILDVGSGASISGNTQTGPVTIAEKNAGLGVTIKILSDGTVYKTTSIFSLGETTTKKFPKIGTYLNSVVYNGVEYKYFADGMGNSVFLS